MEKDQQNVKSQKAPQQDDSSATKAPGQILPASTDADKINQPSTSKEEHSESSLPQDDNKTLGTP